MGSSTPERVLIVEDEAKTAQTLTLYLERAGFSTRRAATGEEALRQARLFKPHAVLLDIMLPGVDGFEICRRLREDSARPILFLSARGAEGDRLRAFDLGADDYVQKPFSPREVVSRVEAVLRRARAGAWQDGDHLTYAGIRLERGSRRVTVDGQPVEALTPNETKLLETLLRAPGRVFSRSELVERVLGHDFDGDERTIDSHVKNLRRKLEPGAGRAGRIRTEFGVGYRLEARERA